MENPLPPAFTRGVSANDRRSVADGGSSWIPRHAPQWVLTPPGRFTAYRRSSATPPINVGGEGVFKNIFSIPILE